MSESLIWVTSGEGADFKKVQMSESEFNAQFRQGKSNQPGLQTEYEDRALTNVGGGKESGGSEGGNGFPKDFPGYEVLGQVEGMTPAKLAAMSDEDVLAIKGIGKKTLEEIRAYGK